MKINQDGQILQDYRGQLYAALVAAAFALAIAVGGYLHQNGKIEGSLEALNYREERIEAKVDLLYEEVVKLRERSARIEERDRTARTGERVRAPGFSPPTEAFP